MRDYNDMHSKYDKVLAFFFSLSHSGSVECDPETHP